MSESRVELIGDADCPNMDAARRVLRRALPEAGLPPRWDERIQEPDDPDRVPSPTIRVDGRDVAGEPDPGAGCRIYRDAAGNRLDAPPVEVVVRALESERP